MGLQVRTLGKQYQEWDTDADVNCILLKGAGGKVPAAQLYQ